MDVRVFDDIAALQSAAADEIASYITAGGTDVGLAGGNTPRRVHEHLGAMAIDWSSVTLWLGDERWVPHDHAESNTRMARETLGPKAAASLLPPDTSGTDPAIAAAHYEIALQAKLATDVDGRLRPGLVVLGMGDDGHTASLFPSSSALDVRNRDYVATFVDSKDSWRLTATLPALWSATRLLFLVTGAGKADVVREILEDGVAHPAQLVASGATEVVWMLDAPAASQLSLSRPHPG